MLELSQVITYVLALSIAAAIPGPGMTALVARSVGSGALTGFAMLLGLILGDLTYLSFAVFGLSVLAKNFNTLFIFVKWASVAYLCYLAWQFWHAHHQSLTQVQALKTKDILSATVSGYTISLSNPKTIAFYLALLPVMLELEKITIQTWGLVLIPLTTIVLMIVGGIFILGAIAVRRALSTQKAQKMLHRGASTAMVIAAGSMISREL